MLIIAQTLSDVVAQHDRVVGFFGHPPQEVLRQAVERHGADLLDLDIDYGAPSARVVPQAYCHIIRHCVDNALALGPRLACLVAATGKEKCDAGRFAAWVIRDLLDIEVIFTENSGLVSPNPPLLSQARGPLNKRVTRIMQSIVNPLSAEEIKAATAAHVEPTHGFWGTPPHPIELLELFPETTRIFGWTRCVEQGRPDDLELEMTVDEELPIVFFSQGFCPKAALAAHLAEKHRGMHVDTHDALGAATQAKIEAFIRLSGSGGTL